jgi:ABC-type nickel/cobalt efflux system permease component RcnA
VVAAAATFEPGDGPGRPLALSSGRRLATPVAVRAPAASGFAALIDRDHLSAGVVLLSLTLAMFWGAAHALSPGHGKAIVAAYLVGAGGTRRDALVLGVTVTTTHTIGVFALGLITLSLSEFILPEDLYPWLNLASAVLVVAVGVAVLQWRVREWRSRADVRPDAGHGHGHDHGHAHDHGHGHAHGHAHDHGHGHDHGTLSRRGLLGVGISGGLIPCPTALVVLLGAISLQRVGYGLALIGAFSVGLAATMTAIGLLAVSARRVFARVDLDRGLLRVVPTLSAIAILALGVAMVVRAVPALA